MRLEHFLDRPRLVVDLSRELFKFNWISNNIAYKKFLYFSKLWKNINYWIKIVEW